MNKARMLRSMLIGSVSLFALVSGAAAQTVSINIPAEDLKTALDDYIRQSKVELVYNVKDIAGVQSHAVHGNLTPAMALDQLLLGTGIAAKRDATGSVVVFQQSQRRAEADPPPTPAESVPDTGVEQVVVTGSSIRGAAPVGSNLITVDQKAVQSIGAQDIQEVMQTVPSLSNANAITQGEIRSDYYAPSIHDLGASASNSTLVIIDGHRMPQGGTSHSLSDPNIIPILALQRVEVLASGASSVYGSDAVAGVINFITRSNYEGLQMTAQAKEADGYKSYTANLLFGKGWGDGNILFAYSHIYESAVSYATRPWIGGDHTAQGGTNFNSFNCASPTLQVGNNYYLGPNYATSVTSAQANAPCNITPYSQLIPNEIRDNAMFKVTQTYGRLTMSADLIVGLRQDITVQAPGTGSVTVYGPGSGKGSQINSFFQAPAGAPTATSETVRFFAQGLIPNGLSNSSATTIYSDVNASYNIDDNWEATLSNTLGKDVSSVRTSGGLCSSCVNLALNGTTNASGSTTTPSIPGTNTIVTQALTPANQLDIWNPPGSTNRTSSAVLAGLANSQTSNIDYNSFDQLRLVIDGKLFSLPGGDLKVAIGGEQIRYGLIQDIVSSNNTGPSSTGTSFNEYRFSRTVKAAFVELQIPIISPEMNIPLVNKLEFNVSGRIDEYSDVGHTSNPKFAATWEVIEGLKVFGNYATAFVAPPLDSAGAPNSPFDGHYNSGSTGVGTWSGAFNLPTRAYPGIAGVLPGCAANAVSCAVATSNTPGIEIYGGLGPELKPARGDDWTLGVDYAPTFIPGLTLNATLFNNIYKGGVTSPSPSGDVLSPALQGLIVPCPTGCSAAEIATRVAGTPVTGALPQTAYFFIYYDQRNVINMSLQGIDFTGNYQFDTDSWGSFRVGDSFTLFTNWQENYGGGPNFNVLNHEGVNTTFPAVQLQSRASLGWDFENYEVDLFANYTGGYRNWSSTSVAPVLTDANGLPVSGGDAVKANLTFDGHVAYNFTGGVLGGAQIYFDAKNMFSRRPPFYNQSQGYDYFVANPLGRIISVGVRTTF